MTNSVLWLWGNWDLNAGIRPQESVQMITIMLSCSSRVQLFVTSWTVARQAPLSMGFSRQEYWSGLPCPPPGDLPHPGIEPDSALSPALQADSLPLSCQGSRTTTVLNWYSENIHKHVKWTTKSCMEMEWWMTRNKQGLASFWSLHLLDLV